MAEPLPTEGPNRAVELLELRDRLDRLDGDLRDRRIGLIVGPLVAAILSAPVLVVLFFSASPIFMPFLASLLAVGAAILYAMTADRRRLEREREALGDRIEEIERMA